MEGFLFAPYNFNVHPGCGPIMAPVLHGNPKFHPQNWAKKGPIYVPPEALDYLDMFKRAQLKAILSQVNPNLTPRLRKANTKEFGVQVNAKVDAVVQCSLGPKTLYYRERILFDRRFFALPVRSGRDGAGPGAHVRDVDPIRTEQETTNHTGLLLQNPREDPRKLIHQGPKGFNFQFLEQKYGFFHCSQCNVRWESAYVWCISGTSKVYFKQLCRKCQIGFNPYRVEAIQCKVCSQTRCCCKQKERHIDMKRPHRQDLCGRCRGKRISCDTTFSYKYIV